MITIEKHIEGGINTRHLKSNPLAAIHSLEIGLSAALYERNSLYGNPRTLEEVADEARNDILKLMRDLQTQPCEIEKCLYLTTLRRSSIVQSGGNIIIDSW